MESKTARLTVLIDPAKKAAFEAFCAEKDITPSQVVRQLIRDYLVSNGVTYATQSGTSRPTAIKAAGKKSSKKSA